MMPQARALLGLLFAHAFAEEESLVLLQKQAHLRRGVDGEKPSPMAVIQPVDGPLAPALASTAGDASYGTCTLDKPGCQSLCLWLKLVSEESPDGTCPLFEWSLKTCGFASAKTSTDFGDMSCAVMLLRAGANKKTVGQQVEALEQCLHTVPSKTRGGCKVGIELLHDEVLDWKKEVALLRNATLMRDQLNDASEVAQTALDTHTAEEQAIAYLKQSLQKAESLPGYYLPDEIHQAREYLDTLSPIPAVKRFLGEAMASAQQALEAKSLAGVKEAVTRLESTISVADKLKRGIWTDEAKKRLDELRALRNGLQIFDNAMGHANVSVVTKQNMPETISKLSSAIELAENIDLSDELPLAENLLKIINASEVAKQNLITATKVAEWMLTTPGGKGLNRLNVTLNALNASMQQATALNISSNNLPNDPIGTLDRITYSYDARLAMHNAIEEAHNVLENGAGVLSDNGEEKAEETLRPAIKWSEEVGLRHGVGAGGHLLHTLRHKEVAKEHIARSLIEGNASVSARSGEAVAVHDLVKAIALANHRGITAGVASADDLLRLLRSRVASKARMATAQEQAQLALLKGMGEDQAILALNASVAEANSVGLLEDVEMGTKLTRDLIAALRAKQQVQRVLNDDVPERDVQLPRFNDSVPSYEFNRTGYKVRDLPEVIGSRYDGDSNFREHVAALNKAIAMGKERGVVDPEMSAQLLDLEAKHKAYDLLQEALVLGNQSMQTKVGVEQAVGQLRMAVQEGVLARLDVGLGAYAIRDAKHMLTMLRPVLPVVNELAQAWVQANVSLSTVSHMGESIFRLDSAIIKAQELQIQAQVPAAISLKEKLEELKAAYSYMKAAVIQGQMALQREEGEETAIVALQGAVAGAKKIGIERDVAVAEDLLQELVHMNAEHSQIAAAMMPASIEGGLSAKLD